MTMQRWRCSVRRLTRRRDRHHQAVLSEQQREMTQVLYTGSSMDSFKVACIFTKVEFIGYVSNMCIVWLQLDLSCNLVV